MKKLAKLPNLTARIVVGLAMFIAFLVANKIGGKVFLAWVVVIALLMVNEINSMVKKRTKNKSFYFILYTTLLVLLPALICLYLRQQYGYFFCLWLVASVSAYDASAYFAGSLIGGPKIMPRISPKKTVSGTFSGILASILVTIAFYGISLERVKLGLLVGLAAFAGDMVESWIKRRHKVKDTGRALPGHGGLLDRCDSLIGAFYLVIIYVNW